MATQQVIAPPAKAGMFVVLTVKPGSEAAVIQVLTDISAFTKSVGFRAPDEYLICNIGIGADLWDRMFDAPGPAGLHPFREIIGQTHTAISTPGDLLVHLRAGRIDMCFELARLIVDKLGSHIDVVDEVHGFKFFDERDLLGFVDGTANPTGAKGEATVTIGQEDEQYAGGSYVIVQKYLHDLIAWESLTVEQQENAFGRTKLRDVEMDDDVKPSNSHVALNTVHDEHGQPLEIVRDNLPFGSVGAAEYGTYFIGYAKDSAITERMLNNMFIGVPEGNHDRILDFSVAKTGSMFFVPSLDLLDHCDSLTSQPKD